MEKRQVRRIATGLNQGTLVERSILRAQGSGQVSALLANGGEHKLLVIGEGSNRFQPTQQGGSGATPANVVVGDWTAANVAILSEYHHHLLPSLPPESGPSFGFGARIHDMAYGHIDSMEKTDPDASVFPMFAQQSPREFERTGSNAAELMLGTQRAVMERGWKRPWSGDADHNMTFADVDEYWNGGFRNAMYTVDPRAHVQSAESKAPQAEVQQHFDELPWEDITLSSEEFLGLYGDKTFTLPGNCEITITREEAMRAAVLYGKAVVHCNKMYRHLCSKDNGKGFVLEFSVDESDADTTPAQHFVVASLCQRLDIKLYSLAPRFPGAFEKGIDYNGDLKELTEAAKLHIAIARKFGNYRLSVHSGSDKFSTYEMFAKVCDGQVHVKTAGTSFLETVRMFARYYPALFREALDKSKAHFDEARLSYVIRGTTEEIVDHRDYEDQALEALLFVSRSTRQCLHVNFGEIMGIWGAELRALRRDHTAEYDLNMAAWLARHVQPFVRA